ncbi:MAG: hypothetical protein KDE27_05880 [Planctomycetes bacterium]|nr:hypothetical protein [Planctomycetota bacterium]
MTKSSTTRRDAHTARVVLRMIKGRRHTSAASASERVMSMMADLDKVLLYLPQDPPDDIITDVERVVMTLRTADQCLTDGNTASGMQSLDLARARLDRIAARLAPADEPTP